MNMTKLTLSESDLQTGKINGKVEIPQEAVSLHRRDGYIWSCTEQELAECIIPKEIATKGLEFDAMVQFTTRLGAEVIIGRRVRRLQIKSVRKALATMSSPDDDESEKGPDSIVSAPRVLVWTAKIKLL